MREVAEGGAGAGRQGLSGPIRTDVASERGDIRTHTDVRSRTPPGPTSAPTRKGASVGATPAVATSPGTCRRLQHAPRIGGLLGHRMPIVKKQKKRLLHAWLLGAGCGRPPRDVPTSAASTERHLHDWKQPSRPSGLVVRARSAERRVAGSSPCDSLYPMSVASPGQPHCGRPHDARSLHTQRPESGGPQWRRPQMRKPAVATAADAEARSGDGRRCGRP